MLHRNTATNCYKRLAFLLSSKREQPYCTTMAWIRCTLSFSLLRSSIQCVRGARSAGGHAYKQLIDLVSNEAKICIFSLWSFSEPWFPLYSGVPTGTYTYSCATGLVCWPAGLRTRARGAAAQILHVIHAKPRPLTGSR